MKSRNVKKVIALLGIFLSVSLILVFLFSPILFIQYEKSDEVQEYLEEKYNGTFEYISGRNFNNGLNGEGFLQGKEYLFKYEEGILSFGYSVTSRTSPDILSTGKDTMISDNYIQKCAYAMCTPLQCVLLQLIQLI